MEHIKPQTGGGHVTDPQHGYERSDADVRGVIAFLVMLLFSAVVINLVGYGFYRLLDRLAVERDMTYLSEGANKMVKPKERAAGTGAGTPSMQAESTEQTTQRLVSVFPGPRLQTDDVYDLRVMRGQEDLLLNHYTWVDKNAGVVRIPVERAMELIAQRGLPTNATTPQPPLSPTAGQQPQQSMPSGGPGNH